MLIYNTTYAVTEEDLACFLAWAQEKMISAVHADGILTRGRLARILSHSDEEGGHSFSLQFEVADSAALHKWFLRQGRQLQQEMQQIFGNRIVGFSTLMEVME